MGLRVSMLKHHTFVLICTAIIIAEKIKLCKKFILAGFLNVWDFFLENLRAHFQSSVRGDLCTARFYHSPMPAS